MRELWSRFTTAVVALRAVDKALSTSRGRFRPAAWRWCRLREACTAALAWATTAATSTTTGSPLAGVVVVVVVVVGPLTARGSGGCAPLEEAGGWWGGTSDFTAALGLAACFESTRARPAVLARAVDDATTTACARLSLTSRCPVRVHAFTLVPLLPERFGMAAVPAIQALIWLLPPAWALLVVAVRVAPLVVLVVLLLLPPLLALAVGLAAGSDGGDAAGRAAAITGGGTAGVGVNGVAATTGGVAQASAAGARLFLFIPRRRCAKATARWAAASTAWRGEVSTAAPRAEPWPSWRWAPCTGTAAA